MNYVNRLKKILFHMHKIKSFSLTLVSLIDKNFMIKVLSSALYELTN
jgi:hypothetical protein